MNPHSTTPKLYCYVDETGQDTLGEIFIVSVVVAGENREALTAALETIEQASGKRNVKWRSSRHQARLEYMQAVLSSPAFKNTLYFASYMNNESYMALTVLSTAKAILSVATEHHPRAAVYVDGLPKARLRWFATKLRHLSIRTNKVAGIRREETDALIRLADACCGWVRQALAVQHPHITELFEGAKPQGYLKEL